jgi:hypothetical protein
VGLGIVLIFWIIIGAAIASVGALTLGGATAFFTRNVPRGRRRSVLAAILFPFVCLAWGGFIFVVQGVVNETLLDRDLGIGDTWHCPLPNGYAILMIDLTDQGWVYNPRTQPLGIVGDQSDSVSGVKKLQVAGRYILGASTKQRFEDLRTYFIPTTSSASQHTNSA